jgi:hypothetical protein
LSGHLDGRPQRGDVLHPLVPTHIKCRHTKEKEKRTHGKWHSFESEDAVKNDDDLMQERERWRMAWCSRHGEREGGNGGKKQNESLKEASAHG